MKNKRTKMKHVHSRGQQVKRNQTQRRERAPPRGQREHRVVKREITNDV